MLTLAAVAIGFCLDLAWGDPRWLPHPVIAMGRAISWCERHVRPLFPQTSKGQLVAGALPSLALPALSCALAAALLRACSLVGPWLRLAVESFMCYQLLATCELRRQSTAVRERLEARDLSGARRAVSMIVGRETAGLDEAGVARAAVETVAENASDGVIAPLLFMMAGGAPAGMLYKAINTADSMVGYRTPRYERYGKVAARLDDVANWLPARACALLMIALAPLAGLSLKGAWRIWRRDRHLTASPNAGQTEAAMAGALGVALGGPARYFGQAVDKPWLGDPTRPIGPEDIRRANRLMLICAIAALVIFGVARALVVEVVI